MLFRSDTLAAMRIESSPKSVISSFFASLESGPADAARAVRAPSGEALQAVPRSGFAHFLSSSPPVRHAPHFNGPGVRVRYFGHACVLLQSSRCSILFDPVVTCDASDCDRRLTLVDLPDRIDYVVLSHCHQDHFCPETLLQLRHKIGTVIVPPNNRGELADPSMKLILRHLGFHRIRTLDAFESVELPEGCVVGVPFSGEHGDLDIHTRQSAYVTLAGRRFLFLVDSDGIDPGLYKRLARRFNNVDAVFLGMECFGAPVSWLYGPLFTRPLNRKNDESRRLSGCLAERAWGVVDSIGCSQAFVYAMGQEPWLRYLMGLEYQPDSFQLRECDTFFDRCRAGGIHAERLFGCAEWVWNGSESRPVAETSIRTPQADHTSCN